MFHPPAAVETVRYHYQQSASLQLKFVVDWLIHETNQINFFQNSPRKLNFLLESDQIEFVNLTLNIFPWSRTHCKIEYSSWRGILYQNPIWPMHEIQLWILRFLFDEFIQFQRCLKSYNAPLLVYWFSINV